jgi:hypothetical protein
MKRSFNQSKTGHSMKTKNLTTIGAAICLKALLAGPAAAFVYENEQELVSTGDLNGDGHADVVIVDKVTGDFRTGYGNTLGAYDWAEPRSSGMEGVSGFSLGRLAGSQYDTLVFTSPDANRVNLVRAESMDDPPIPGSLYLSGLEPNVVACIDVGGWGGGSSRDDLVVGTLHNQGSSPVRLHAIRNQWSTYTEVDFTQSQFPFARPNRIFEPLINDDVLTILRRDGSFDRMYVFDLSAGSLDTVAVLIDAPQNSDYAFGMFGSSPVARYLVYKPGTSLVHVHALVVPIPGTIKFSDADIYDFGQPVRQIFVIPAVTGGRLLVVYSNGDRAEVFDFDGFNPPTFVQEFLATSGESITGAIVVGKTRFMILSAPTGSGRSERAEVFDVNGSTYSSSGTSSLPSLDSFGPVANVFEFANEPFVTSAPLLLRSLSAGDWTSDLSPLPGPAMSVQKESFVDSAQGLADPSVVQLGAPNPQTQFGLVNQHTESFSLAAFTKPAGEVVAEIEISPPPGHYPAGIQVTLTSPTPGVKLFYRLDGQGDYVLYSTPIPLFKATTVSYLATASGGRKSVIRHADYTFAEAPGDLDSDRDGVPDYVEIYSGLNPASGPDGDGDGFSDLDELTSGYDPDDATDHPPSTHQRLDLNFGFDIIQTLAPWDGTVDAATLSRTGTATRVHTLAGELKSFSVTEPLGHGSVVDPAAAHEDIAIEPRDRLVAMSTDQHFDIATLHPDPRIGRELIGLNPVPEVQSGLDVPYVYTGASLDADALGWIAAAIATRSQATPVEVTGELDVYDTLTALMVERKVREILLARGMNAYSNMTLFSFRNADAGRAAPSAAELLDLEYQAGPNLPGFKLRDLHAALDADLSASGPPATAMLRALTREIYRISSALHNGAPEPFPSPVNTLRDFLYTGVLQSNYLASTTMTPGDMAQAHAEAGSLLAALNGRPIADVLMEVRPDTGVGSCTILDETGVNATWALFDSIGLPYGIFDVFQLPPGTLVQLTGYPDAPGQGCAANAMEVISVSLGSVPSATAEDTDGDLLLDDLEMLIFGGLAQTGLDDFDGDGNSNLQEFLDGTDAANAASGNMVMADLSPPLVELLPMQNGELSLSWHWPESYSDHIEFTVLKAGDLSQPFTPLSFTPTLLGGGVYEVTVLPKENVGGFYVVQLSLR